MGNTVSSQVSQPTDEVVTVTEPDNSHSSDSASSAQESVIYRLQQLPQVQHNQPARPDEQVWQELAEYTQGKLQLPPDSTLCLIEAYKAWCQTQTSAIHESQQAVNNKIKVIDELATTILTLSSRSQQRIDEASKLLTAMTTTQHQVDEIATRLSACASMLDTAKRSWELKHGQHMQPE